MAATVHGWCGFVEKSSHVVCLLMVLNKMWIPDVLIDIIKDYLFIDRLEVLRKFFKQYINRSVNDICTSNQLFVDVYGRGRIVLWQTGYIYGGGDLHLQGSVCVTCGDSSQLHNNLNGCCSLMWDAVDEPILLEEEVVGVEEDVEVSDETIAEINAEAEADAEEIIPEVSWDTDIPLVSASASPFVYTDPQYAQVVWAALKEAREEAALLEYNYYDIEAEMADYAEYKREVEMERHSYR
jgi:hypothetical protein